METSIIANFIAGLTTTSPKVVVGLFMSAVSSGYGSEYIVALLGLEIQDGVEYSNTIEYEVVVTNPGDESIDVTFSDIEGLKGSKPVTPGVAETMSFTQEASLNGSEIANKSIRVTSDKDFLLQVFVHSSSHLEGYLGIPVTHLGTLYRVSTFCALGGYCQLAIAATQPNTTRVYLQIPVDLPDIVFCIEKKFFRSKRDRYLYLKEYDILQIETAGDLSGALIYSDKPVAVFAGTRNLTIGGTMGHLVEQLAPVDRWGNEFILGTLGDNMYGDLVKITAAEADTVVEASGFPKLVISNINHTITKRLDADTVGYIKANKPVQVVQFSGITYATNGETPRPSMTVVPSTGNSQKKFVLSCGKNAVESADYHTAVHKTEDSHVTVTDATETNRPLTYTKYNVRKSTVTADPSPSFTFTAETSGEQPFGGILTCNRTAAMPMTFEKQDETTEATADISRCIEDETFYAYYDMHDTKKIITKDVNISNFDLIKLRVKTCGHAIVVLESSSSKTVLTMTPATIVATKCTPNCDTTAKFTDDSYNSDPEKDCTVDMSFYWIYLDKVNQKMCLGYGPYPDTTDCSRELADGFLFTNMLLSMVSSPVFYSYDLHVGECDAVQSDWRCEDTVDNCHRYKKEICTDNKYGQWVMDNCRRYCGKCQSDIYGRRFLVILPHYFMLHPIEKCEVFVTASGGDPNVAIGSKIGIIPGMTMDNAVVYDCKGPITHAPFTVIADQDVHVTVAFNKDDFHGTYQIYPVDTIGKEMLGLTDDSTIDCFFATVDYPATVTAFYEGSKSWGPAVDDGGSFLIDPGNVQRIGASAVDVFQGVLFRSSRPIYMFCGDSFLNERAGFYQVPPTASLGKEFVTPGFEPVVVQRPFDATLRIQADSDNTLVTLAGDFDAIIPIYKRGDYHDQPIEAGTSYRLTANNNINVAIILIDVHDADRRSFSFIPPYSTTATKHSVYIPLYSGVSPLMKEFEVTKLQSYYVHTNKTSSLSAVQTVTGEMLAHHETYSFENYYSALVVFNANNNWMTFAGPRVFNSGQYLIEMSLCQTRINAVADGLDNDCDGLTDEDVCFSAYGNDYDLDGGFGEDCGTVDTDSTGPPLPPDPQCIPINKPDDQCWTTGACKCSWVKAIELKETMTDEEIKEKEEEDIERYKEALQVDTEALSSETSKKESAEDVRQSAANIGYLGITMFALVFGGLVLLDIKCIVRDMMIFCCNVREGLERLWDFINGEDM